jgi:hypothetical protein
LKISCAICRVAGSPAGADQAATDDRAAITARIVVGGA